MRDNLVRSGPQPSICSGGGLIVREAIAMRLGPLMGSFIAVAVAVKPPLRQRIRGGFLSFRLAGEQGFEP